MQIVKFQDGPTGCETWELADGGWDDWAAVVDRFLAFAIAGIAAEYGGEAVEWLEINGWPTSGRLMVFPSQEGPFGNRGERVSFELSSKHLETACSRIGEALPAAERDTAWSALGRRVWCRVSECLASGTASHELTRARRIHKLRIAGYDYEPGEKLFWLTHDGALPREPGAMDEA